VPPKAPVEGATEGGTTGFGNTLHEGVSGHLATINGA
jgi:hypothetical protein